MIVPLDTAAAIAEVKPATIRQWVRRGHIRRYGDGYETAELLHWIDSIRNNAMLQLRTEGVAP
jgi:hypothetical protein